MKSNVMRAVVIGLLALVFSMTAGSALAAGGRSYSQAGDLARRSGQQDKAVELYTKALQAGGMEPALIAQTYLNRGKTYEELGDTASAFRDYTDAIRTRPGYALAHYNRGVLFSMMGKQQEALRDFTRMLEISPDDWRGFYNRGLALFNLGEYERSVSDFTEAANLAPDQGAIYANRALAFDKLGRPREGLADAQKYQQLDPGPNAQQLVDYFKSKLGG